MSLTVEALAKIIDNIPLWDCYDTPHAQAEALLPYIERHIAAGQTLKPAELAAEYCRGRDDGWDAAEQRYRQPPKPAGNAIDGLLATARPFLAEELLLKLGYTWSGSGWVAPVAKPAGAVPLPEPVGYLTSDGEQLVFSTTQPVGVLASDVYGRTKLHRYGDAREAAGRAVAVPEGYCLMPIKGTPEIFTAMRMSVGDGVAMGPVYYAALSAGAIAAPIPQQPAAEGAGREAVAIIADGWNILFVGSGPIAEIARKHSLKIGDKLYTHPVADAGGVTDEMVERACEAYDEEHGGYRIHRLKMQRALAAALTPEVRHGE